MLERTSDPRRAPVSTTSASPPSAGETDPLAFACPRCAAAVVSRFYGPCKACRGALRAELAAESRAVEVRGYEPKMNVTPNAVALKDD
jgi:hypothetical protein